MSKRQLSAYPESLRKLLVRIRDGQTEPLAEPPAAAKNAGLGGLANPQAGPEGAEKRIDQSHKFDTGSVLDRFGKLL
jgi:hypothetical protein